MHLQPSDRAEPEPEPDDLDRRTAARLLRQRTDRGWSIDELAARSGVSRSTLSRIERGRSRPTPSVLHRLCAAHSLTLSRLFADVENGPPGRVTAERQQVWRDPATGYLRRCVSPLHPELRAELVAVELPAGAAVEYDRPPVHDLEHHLWLQEGPLTVSVGDKVWVLEPGDCLRYRLDGASRLHRPGPDGARYLLVLVTP